MPGCRRRSLGVAAGLLLAACTARAHDAGYWESLRQSGFAVPDGTDLPVLAREAIGLLDSPNPRLRDAIGYEALARWIHAERRFDRQSLAPLVGQLRARAVQGLGQCLGDGLYGRSFSLLVLSVVAAADDEGPLLDDAAFHGLVALGIDALGRECDLRGYDEMHGWGHATAHAADLLKFLARNPRLQPREQAGIVAAIEGRLASAGQVFAWGEEARLAATLAAVAAREDAQEAPLLAWFARLEQQAASLHAQFDACGTVRLLAQRNALAHFAVLLDATDRAAGRGTLRQALRHALLVSR